MSYVGRVIRAIARSAGYKIETFGSRSLVLVDVRRPADAWFSHESLLHRLIADHRIDLVIDVGANEGQFGRRLRRHYTGDLISFEPIAAVHSRLVDNVAGDPKWKALRFGLGAVESECTIYVARASVFSSLLQSNAYAQARFKQEELQNHQEIIQVRRLDAVLPDVVPDLPNRRILLKMDTQGFDMQVFAGSRSILQYVYALQSEVSCKAIYAGMPHWTDVVNEYERAGFGVAGLFPVTWDSDQVVEYDCVMTRTPGVGAGNATDALALK
jgi:FkbM family methyltransferase